MEFACTVDTGRFRGEATCYAGHGDLAQFVKDLVSFSVAFEGDDRPSMPDCPTEPRP